MKRLSCFLIVGLAFTLLQVANIEAQDPNCTGPDCITADHSGMPPMGEHPAPMGDTGMAPPDPMGTMIPPEPTAAEEGRDVLEDGMPPDGYE